jgi:hypothetical protein
VRPTGATTYTVVGNNSIGSSNPVQVTVRIAAPSKIYTDNGDGTVTDPTTMLTWKRCAEGQTWTGSDCSGTATAYTWTAAVGLNGGGFAGKSWRLPSKDELSGLVDLNFSPTITATAFPNAPAVKFWTGTSDTDPENAWVVDFGTGTTSSTAKQGLFDGYKARLVSGGQVTAPVCTLSASPASVTPGASSILTANCTGATTLYQWDGTCTGTTGSTCTVTPVTTTTYTVVGSSATLSGSASATVTVTSTPVCSYTLSNSAIGVDAAANSGTITVTASSLACVPWQAVSSDSWIAITAVSPTVSGSVAYTIAANASTSSRTGTLVIAGKTLTLTQLGQTAPMCTLTASPTAIPAGGSSILTASCTGAKTYAWSDSSCSSTSLTCTVSPTATTTYKVQGKNAEGTVVAEASQTVTLAPVGSYDGIYQWFDPDPANKDSRKTYLSLHQNGANMIATLYFNVSLPASVPLKPDGGGAWSVAVLDVFDLMNGTVTGNTAQLTGTRSYEQCNVKYNFTFDDTGQLTATRTNVSGTAAATLLGTDCAKNLAAENATLTMHKIPFGAASAAAIAGPVDGIYQWSTGNYLSMHQDGADLIATNYFNEASFINGLLKLNSYDLLGGSFKGATAQISGTRYHGACNVTYSLTVNADGSLTATRDSVVNTSAANSAGINCKAIVEAAEGAGATFAVPKLSFK